MIIFIYLLFIYIYIYVYVYIFIIYILLYVERCRVRKICCSIAAQVLQTIQGVTAYMLNINFKPDLITSLFPALEPQASVLPFEGLPMPVFPLGFRWFFSDFLTLFFVCVCAVLLLSLLCLNQLFLGLRLRDAGRCAASLCRTNRSSVWWTVAG